MTCTQLPLSCHYVSQLITMEVDIGMKFCWLVYDYMVANPVRTPWRTCCCNFCRRVLIQLSCTSVHQPLIWRMCQYRCQRLIEIAVLYPRLVVVTVELRLWIPSPILGMVQPDEEVESDWDDQGEDEGETDKGEQKGEVKFTGSKAV